MSRRRHGERGAVMMITAFVVLSALLMAGLVLDAGQLRVDRRVNKGVTDIAARAGLTRLSNGPRSGVCKAREFLLANAKAFGAFDPGSELWSTVAPPAGATSAVIGDPCPAVGSGIDALPCTPNDPTSWVRFQATAASQRFGITIQAGYLLPDPAFPADAGMGDTGAPELGSCDNLAVILSERQSPAFSQVGGASAKVVKVRSVARLNPKDSLSFAAALHLLERTECDVLAINGNATRVIVHPSGIYPGTIQVDSDRSATSGQGGANCSQSTAKVLNLNSANVGGGLTAAPFLACSTTSTATDCWPGTGTHPSRLGMFALLSRSASSVITSFGTNYGDTPAVPSPRVGRGYVDARYRANVVALDADARNVIMNGNATRSLPPGCTTVSASDTCVGNDGSGNTVTWLVVPTASNGCDKKLTTYFNATRSAMQNIWFNCDVSVDAGDTVTLSAARAFIVVTKQLKVSGTLNITDAAKVYVGGKTENNGIGVDLGSGALNMNAGAASTCRNRTGPNLGNRFVIGNGSMKVSSGFSLKMCQTFTYLASGYGHVPTTDGAQPCLTNSCGNYSGFLTILSGATVDVTAPNSIVGRVPSVTELTGANSFEDLGMWAEVGGGNNDIVGGGQVKLKGMFFFPNAKPFKLSGGSANNETPETVAISAQFVATTMTVSGNSVFNLLPDPTDSVPMLIFAPILVR